MMTPEQAAELRAMLERASKKAKATEKLAPPTPILNAALGLPSTLLGFPVIVEAGKG